VLAALRASASMPLLTDVMISDSVPMPLLTGVMISDSVPLLTVAPLQILALMNHQSIK
jgi:hypothetical protein